jgi:hypothetical protein
MRGRAALSIGLALAGFLATTGVAGAARSPDLTEIVIGTFLMALGLMLFLSLIYAVKVATGIEKPLPPEEPDAAGHH